MFFDFHAHVYRYPYPTEDGRFLFATPAQLEERFRELEIAGAALQPVLGPELYMPQSVGEIIDLARESGGKYVPFCNVDPRALTNRSDAPLGILLEHYKALGCKGVGEVMPQMEWKDPKLQNLLRCTEKAGLPLLFDMTSIKDTDYGIYDEPGMPQLEASLERFPDLIFVGHGPAFWAEITRLRTPEDRIYYPTYPFLGEGRVGELMRAYPNLWVDLSAHSGANALTRDTEYTARFLTEFSDRILFATDICFADQEIPQPAILKTLLAEKRISRETFEAVAYKNACRLLGLDEARFA